MAFRTPGAQPSAYVTGGHAGAPAWGKQGGGGSQGGWGWGVWGWRRFPIVCGCERGTGRGGSSSSFLSTYTSLGGGCGEGVKPGLPHAAKVPSESAPPAVAGATGPIPEDPGDPGGGQLQKSRPSPLQQKQTHETKPRPHRAPHQLRLFRNYPPDQYTRHPPPPPPPSNRNLIRLHSRRCAFL